jgi:hypothetical protein
MEQGMMKIKESIQRMISGIGRTTFNGAIFFCADRKSISI